MFGASVYEDPPFIVMPFLRNGDILTYLEDHNPRADRHKLVRCALVLCHGAPLTLLAAVIRSSRSQKVSTTS